MLNVNTFDEIRCSEMINWLNNEDEIKIKWLGDGKTSDMIVEILKEKI